MHKYLVIGDIHGRAIWKDIVANEAFDKVIFLGDYITSHDFISTNDQIANLVEILEYKESNPDKVILLRGNHDIQHIGYYWARCSGYDPGLERFMSSNKERYLNDTQWIYIDDELKTVFSHAGISQVWMDEIAHVNCVENIKDLVPSEIFGFTPDSRMDCYGTSPTQPPTWIRPQTLCTCNVKGWDQVVGHTPVTKNIININKATKGKQNIWLCDALELKQYLVIDNRDFIIKTMRNENET